MTVWEYLDKNPGVWLLFIFLGWHILSFLQEAINQIWPDKEQ